MIAAWRITKKSRANKAFDDEGARLYGGRWNHKGSPVIYVSDSLALAALEQFIHLGEEGLRLKFVYFSLKFPDEVGRAELDQADLPSNWRQEPPPSSTKDLGTDWVESGTSAVLRVPSVILPHGFNFLLNPGHPDYGRIEIGQPQTFSFDPRMWKPS